MRLQQARMITDTDPEAAAVQLALLRSASPARRLRLAISLSHSVISLSRGAPLGNPSSAPADVTAGLRFIELHYGADFAAAVRRRLGARRP